MKKRKLWLLAIIFIPSVLLTYKIRKERHLAHDSSRDPDTVTSIVGTFPSQVSKERAVISRLSQEMQRYPKINTFIIKEEASQEFFIAKYVRVGRIDEVIIGPNKELFWWFGRKDAFAASGVTEQDFHRTAKTHGNMKTLFRVKGRYNN